MKKNIFITILALSVVSVFMSCNNPSVSGPFAGQTFKSSNGEVLVFEDGTRYSFTITQDGETDRGSYTVSEDNKTLTFTLDSIFMKEYKVGDKTYLGKSYTKENFQDLLNDYLEFLDCMAQSGRGDSSGSDAEAMIISVLLSDPESVKLVKEELFSDTVYNYSYDEQGHLVLKSGEVTSYYVGSYKDSNEEEIVSVTLNDAMLNLSGIATKDWEWGDDYLSVKDGSLDKTNKTLTFIFSKDSKEYKASYAVVSDTVLTFTFGSDAGFLSSQTSMALCSEENLIATDVTVGEGDEKVVKTKALHLVADDFLKTVSIQYSPDDGSTYYPIEDGKIVTTDSSKKITRKGNVGDEKITITVTAPFFETPTDIDLEYIKTEEKYVFDL